LSTQPFVKLAMPVDGSTTPGYAASFATGSIASLASDDDQPSEEQAMPHRFLPSAAQISINACAAPDFTLPSRALHAAFTLVGPEFLRAEHSWESRPAQ
jgi:hypothetical protein